MKYPTSWLGNDGRRQYACPACYGDGGAPPPALSDATGGLRCARCGRLYVLDVRLVEVKAKHDRAACPCSKEHDMDRLVGGEAVGPCRRCGIGVGKNVRPVPGGSPDRYESSPCPLCEGPA